jgi:tripartite-type tricarboxylate transporter receptor subunit TctC
MTMRRQIRPARIGTRRQFLLYVGAAAALPASARIAIAQNYPARPVRVIVGFAPGGPTDVFARLMAQKLGENLGGQFYVDNHRGNRQYRHGAGGEGNPPMATRFTSLSAPMW